MNSTIPDFTTYEGIDIGAIFSPLYWGTIVSMILSGITIVQAYIYFPSKDHWVLVLTAITLCCLDIASTVMVAESVYNYLIPHYGSLLPFGTLTPVLSSECALGACIVFLSHMFFVWQIRGVSKNKAMARYIVPGIITVLAIFSFVTGIGCAAIMITDKHNVLANRSRRFNIFAGMTKSSAAVADIVATIALVMYLESARTGIASSDSMVKTLMSFVIQRGLLLTSIQVIVVICFFANQNRLYWLAFHVNVTRLYANTFFAMLNGRQRLRNRGNIHTGSNSSTLMGSASLNQKEHDIKLSAVQRHAKDGKQDDTVVKITKSVKLDT